MTHDLTDSDGGRPGVAPRSVSTAAREDRFVVDAATVSMDEMGAYTVVHDLREELGYVVVEGEESWMPSGASFRRDRVIEIEDPVARRSLDEVARPDGLDPQSIQQWDKLEQDAASIPSDAGADARIGIVDSGVIGADPSGPEHPDLPRGSKVLPGTVETDDDGNVTDATGPSYGFAPDKPTPGPVTDPHGTECAGTAAAADDGSGVVGLAPGAEIVDLRVFPADGGALRSDILAAVTVGATPTDETVEVTLGGGTDGPQSVNGAGCDVLNLSLGLPPLVPTAQSVSDPLIAVSPAAIQFLASMYGSAARYALDNGTLPVASAGNSGVGLGIPLSDDRQVPRLQNDEIDAAPVTFPANAPGYVTVGATGPVGYGWSVDGEALFERPLRTELPTHELAQYSNYGTREPTAAGGTAVDVTAGGGNFDLGPFTTDGTVGAGNPIFDLLYTTAFTGDTREGELTPTFDFTAGTSFSAPNVAGLAAYLYSFGDNPDPEAVRTAIQDSARPLPVGRAGQTAAASVGTPNAATDAVFDGDTPSAPGQVPGRLDPANHRGHGHIDVQAAVETFSPPE